MIIIREKQGDREAYIQGYKDGAHEILRDSLDETHKSPVKYNGKAVSEMLDYVEKTEDQLEDMANSGAGERGFSEPAVLDVLTDALGKIDYTKLNMDGEELKILQEKSGSRPGYYSVCLSGGLNGRGIWSNYFEILAKVMFQIELRYPDAFVEKLENDTADDIFYLYIGIPEITEEKVFGDHEPPKQGNKKPGDRERVPASIIKKVKDGEGVIHKYNGSWRIVSMKTNPPTFWDSKYPSKEAAEGGLKAWHANRH